jgi:hypothetical protein
MVGIVSFFSLDYITKIGNKIITCKCLQKQSKTTSEWCGGQTLDEFDSFRIFAP